MKRRFDGGMYVPQTSEKIEDIVDDSRDETMLGFGKSIDEIVQSASENIDLILCRANGQLEVIGFKAPSQYRNDLFPERSKTSTTVTIELDGEKSKMYAEFCRSQQEQQKR